MIFFFTFVLHHPIANSGDMHDNWVKVYASNQPHKVSIVSAILYDNNIESHEINKIDSAYNAIGEIELYVAAENEVLASFIIKQNKL